MGFGGLPWKNTSAGLSAVPSMEYDGFIHCVVVLSSQEHHTTWFTQWELKERVSGRAESSHFPFLGSEVLYRHKLCSS